MPQQSQPIPPQTYPPTPLPSSAELVIFPRHNCQAQAVERATTTEEKIGENEK